MGLNALAACLAIGATCLAGHAQAQSEQRQLLTLAAGEDVELLGTTYHANRDASAIVVVSSELVTAAVIEGSLVQDGIAAEAGEALVTPIDGQRTRRYGFDAQRLLASLPPQWIAAAEAPLEAIAEHQQRRAFWGLVEPLGTNATAPFTPQAEAFRQAYLANRTVLGLRREAAGDRNRLAALTLQRFAAAVVAGEEAVIADLIDPMPFSNASSDPEVWLAARRAVVRQLLADGALGQTLANTGTPEISADGTVSQTMGAVRVGLVMRDRAFFVAAVEPLS
jgi:hypothetical protein